MYAPFVTCWALCHVSLRGSDLLGESGCHFKLVLLFRTLHERPELCGLIRKLGMFIVFSLYERHV